MYISKVRILGYQFSFYSRPFDQHNDRYGRWKNVAKFNYIVVKFNYILILVTVALGDRN